MLMYAHFSDEASGKMIKIISTIYIYSNLSFNQN